MDRDIVIRTDGTGCETKFEENRVIYVIFMKSVSIRPSITRRIAL